MIADDAEIMPPAFFLTAPDGAGYIGTALTRGPWDDNSAHGGPVAALIGREVELFDPDPELATVRLTIELLRPVPLGLLEVAATLLRAGKRVRLVGVELSSAGVVVARAVAVRVRRVPLEAPSPETAEPTVLADPESCAPAPSLIDSRPDRLSIVDAVELRVINGSAREQGPATYWFRVHVPLVDQEPITPLTRALVAADFGNGIASVVPIDTHVFINPELTVHLFRLPVGEWVANDAVTWLQPGGAAVAAGTLFDQDNRNGPVASALQTLFVAAR